ncbi:MAG: hypothetical protein KAG97_04950 [Victivallales bacterium]|nr:hypothetical protein [Victivallales bacterium]
MIVRMLKTTVICLNSEREHALERLRELELMHIDATPLAETEERSKYSAKLVNSNKATMVLEGAGRKGDTKNPPAAASEEADSLAESALALAEEKNEILKKLDGLRKDRDALLPWGEFSPSTLQGIREKDVDVHLCKINRDMYKQFKAETAEKMENNGGKIAFHIVRESKHELHFAIIADAPLDSSELPLVRLPENTSLAKIESDIKTIESRKEKIDAKLAELALSEPALKLRAAELKEHLEFLEKRDSMAESGILAHITGYIPVPNVEDLKAAAKKHGWGSLMTEPQSADDTPTLIKVPRILEISKPIFDFIGISPGYNEWDVSTCFLFFFTIFVGMIVGDAGYGLIFLAAAIFAKFKLHSNEKNNRAVNLMLLLSMATVVWGALNGTYFAIKAELLPSWMHGIDWFTDPELKSKHIQQLCFLIAAIHLSFAHLWKATLYINSRKALGEIGWAMLIWGNYVTALNLIVYPGGKWPLTLLTILYSGGAVLTAIFAIDWKDIGDICNYPFGLIGTFVDLLSYIRLFAVGLATFYIADSFNGMGVMIAEISDDPFAKILLMAAAVIVILLGHILNIVLAGLAILVHGIRLNTLEFSNHMSLQWLGRIYEPFKKSTDG